MNVKILFLVLTIILICTSLILRYIVRKKYFKKELDLGNRFVEGRLLLAIFSQNIYFQKKRFWKGYLLYLLSVAILILALASFYFFLTIERGTG